MTVGASCVVNPRSWAELLLDSAASLRLVDSTLAELYLPAVRSEEFEQGAANTSATASTGERLPEMVWSRHVIPGGPSVPGLDPLHRLFPAADPG